MPVNYASLTQDNCYIQCPDGTRIACLVQSLTPRVDDPEIIHDRCGNSFVSRHPLTYVAEILLLPNEPTPEHESMATLNYTTSLGDVSIKVADEIYYYANHCQETNMKSFYFAAVVQVDDKGEFIKELVTPQLIKAADNNDVIVQMTRQLPADAPKTGLRFLADKQTAIASA